MYQNPFIPGYDVLRKSSYSTNSHDSLSNKASYLISNDVPHYATMFYSPSEHEVISQIKYGNFEQDYSNLREIQQSLNGPPIEFYIPSTFVVAEGVGRHNEKEIVPKLKEKLLDIVNKEALQEIEKAQKEASGKKIKRIEFEDILLLRRRKIRVVFDDKNQYI